MPYIARDRPYAVIVRRGPSNQTCTYGWDLLTDEITLGQWFKGRIYESRCDISPDGQFFLYFAASFRPPFYTWTAISRTPWLTALDLHPGCGTWGGGGQFVDSRKYWTRDGRQSGMKMTSGLELVEPEPFKKGFESASGGTYHLVLWNQGWRPDIHLSDPDYTRRMSVTHSTDSRLSIVLGRYSYQDKYHLSCSVAEDWQEMEGLTWAAFPDEDLLFAREGCLYRIPVSECTNWRDAKLIRDFGNDVFEQRMAPYQGLKI